MKDFFTNSQNSIVTSDRILYTPSSFARNSLLYLQEAGSLRANRAHTSRRANLDSYLFFAVVSGAGTLLYNDISYPLHQDDCVFINCEIPYAHSADPDDLWCLKWIHFNGPTLPAIYDKYKARGGKPVFRPSDIKLFLSLHADLFTTASSSDYIRDMKINGELSALLTLLMSESWNPEESGSKKQRRDLLPVKMYLDENYTKKILLDDLAEKFYINKYYLVKQFKAQYGLSINAYLLEVRITRAKQMLRFTDKSVENIGLDCGLGALTYFSRTFKKVEGMSPSEFRARWSEKNCYSGVF